MINQSVFAVLVEKNGTLKKVSIQEPCLKTLASKCGYKNENNFSLITAFPFSGNADSCEILLYAKNKGRANFENKYEFPPPIDSELLFGNCILLKRGKKNLVKFFDLSIEEWKIVYDRLLGGFEDLENDEDEEDEEDEDEDEDEEEEDEDEDEEEEEDDEEEEEEEEEAPLLTALNKKDACKKSQLTISSFIQTAAEKIYIDSNVSKRPRTKKDMVTKMEPKKRAKTTSKESLLTDFVATEELTEEKYV